MNILIISGGDISGHTDIQCNALHDALVAMGDEVTIMRPFCLEIGHCSGCNSCVDDGECLLDDDMELVIDAFDKADTVVFMSPIRFSGPSSALKTVIDRFQLVWNVPDIVTKKSRRMCALLNGGSSRPATEPTLSILRSFCNSFGGIWVGDAVTKGTDESESSLGPDAESFAREVVHGSE